MLGEVKSLRAMLVMLPLLSFIGCRDDPPKPATHAPLATAPSLAPSRPPARPPEGAPSRLSLQHVLVAYAGAVDAPGHVKRTKEDARVRAAEVRTKSLAGEPFSGLATEYSDDPTARDVRGHLNQYRTGVWPTPFDATAAALPVKGTSEVIETVRGFHVIRRDEDL